MRATKERVSYARLEMRSSGRNRAKSIVSIIVR